MGVQILLRIAYHSVIRSFHTAKTAGMWGLPLALAAKVIQVTQHYSIRTAIHTQLLKTSPFTSTYAIIYTQSSLKL